MIKRLVVGVFVSALTVVGVAPAASAAKSSDTVVIEVQKVKPVKPGKAIDWDTSTPVSGGDVTTQRIDWD